MTRPKCICLYSMSMNPNHGLASQTRLHQQLCSYVRTPVPTESQRVHDSEGRANVHKLNEGVISIFLFVFSMPTLDNASLNLISMRPTSLDYRTYAL